MKGLFLRIIAIVALLLWAIDMVFPWQQIMRSEENRYTAIQSRGKLVVGTINNPISYFIDHAGQAAGLEYELSKAFADYLNVDLEILAMSNGDELFSALKNNKIDIAAANLLYQPNKLDMFQVGPTYNSASWQLVYRKGTERPRSLGELKGSLSIASGSELTELLKAEKEKYPALIWRVNEKLTPEELLIQMADGKIDYVIANSIDVSAVQQIKPNVAVAFDVTDESTVHWYLPSNSYSELQASLLDFMNSAIETGLIARIEEKYFNHLAQFDYVDTRSYLRAIEMVLPKFVPLFEKYKGDLDWRLLAAIAYQESHWNPDATSPTGVRGMMMLTKATAERMRIQDRTDPEQSIKAGSEYLHWLITQMPDTIKEDERIWFALAAYNMGLGHLLDARRLTKSLGGDPDNWLDVKKNLPLLAEKRYYTGLKYGYARGYEAYHYVENIRRYMNSIVHYYRVQQAQIEETLDTQAAEIENINEIKKETDTLATTVTTQ
ncbi:membrane-bound lytic murein transglycosylase MltF [Pasteurella multocida]|uniref:membrane-bound lytic murein transglycosylase MltF n=1 Tax=Pasteurella multocida TaxID=747 RepID=UPI002947F9AE|nr:membrane-bound lytic murein transglycosylase MltF [Pasteurella multocida]MDY0577323.1 membrane-bound lytic murein transglycosylase MltF [Pasteurella multocida]MEB3496645.1 membrane-bound lytic murein transglycosylase MltF [Pasteurella multocida]MEB3500174.1 membrane-bound lytic murein transglycosylase MltF [Pasteurella multocida]HDR1053112.1 membrane-bound lytic murein transglycosylase MltF [Pasteurella multocida]HDR1059523.1 membrane-bound lytic murein transglycosylase MltF [Pasteurella mu